MRRLATVQPAVILSMPRVGSTFLTHCLSNHPDIFCMRGEPLGSRRHKLGLPAVELLHWLLYDQTHYEASVCEISRAQYVRLSGIKEYLLEHQPAVIVLIRENVLRQALASLLAKKVPRHTTRRIRPISAEIEPDKLLASCRKWRNGIKNARNKAGRFDKALEVTYAEMVGGEGHVATELQPQAAKRICKFLGVPVKRMRCNLRPTCHWPLDEMITNWRDVRRAIKASKFAYCLKE